MRTIVDFEIPAGKEIKRTIIDFLLENNIENGYIVGAIGSVVDVRIAAPVAHELPPQTVEVPYGVSAEVVGFTGEVMPWDKVDSHLASVYPDKDDPVFVHIHIAAAMAGGQVFGGGLRSGKAFRALRVFVLPL